MSFTREEKDGIALLRIDGAMTIEGAVALKKEMLDCLNHYEGIMVDMNRVSECDVTAFQLLWSLKLAAGKIGKNFAITQISQPCLSTFEKCGLDPDNFMDAR